MTGKSKRARVPTGRTANVVRPKPRPAAEMAAAPEKSAQPTKSGRGVNDIDPARLVLLNSGAVAAATLTECLAVDFAVLMRAAAPDTGEDAALVLERATGLGVSRRMALAGRLLLDRFGLAAVDWLQAHPSDTVRGWACFLIGAADGLTLDERLSAIRPFADDLHFGVREWAWMAARPHLVSDLNGAVSLLAGWTADPSERIRRFTSEAIRPRGVWCAHIAALKERPEIALPVLEPLRADPARYVQDSVGNWLNDAAKDQPDWVRVLCRRWTAESASAATAHICKRAQRSMAPK